MATGADELVIASGQVLCRKREGQSLLEFEARPGTRKKKLRQEATHVRCRECDGVFPKDKIEEMCQECLEKLDMRRSISAEHTLAEEKLHTLKTVAARAGYTFRLSDEQAIDLMKQPCYYCGSKEPSSLRGIDRKNNDVRGYTLANSVPACPFCNIGKLDYTSEHFVSMCKHIATRRCNKGNFGLFPEVFPDSPSAKRYKQYASRANLSIDEATFKAIISQDCYFCGKKNTEHHCNGIDRIDSRNRVYEVGNIQSCCKCCNGLKWNLAQGFFLEKVLAVAQHWQANGANGGLECAPSLDLQSHTPQ